MDCIVHGVTESDMTELTSLTLTGFKHFIYLKLCSIKIICKIQQLKLVKKKKKVRGTIGGPSSHLLTTFYSCLPWMLGTQESSVESLWF